MAVLISYIDSDTCSSNKDHASSNDNANCDDGSNGVFYDSDINSSNGNNDVAMTAMEMAVTVTKTSTSYTNCESYMSVVTGLPWMASTFCATRWKVPEVMAWHWTSIRRS